MRISKLTALAAIAFLGWQQEAVLGSHLETVKALGPLARTYMEMRTYRTGLMAYRNENRGATPRDLAGWLDDSYGRGDRASSVDLFGTPYQVGRGEDRWSSVLRSCGPDTICRTEDDLVVSLDTDA